MLLCQLFRLSSLTICCYVSCLSPSVTLMSPCVSHRSLVINSLLMLSETFCSTSHGI